MGKEQFKEIKEEFKSQRQSLLFEGIDAEEDLLGSAGFHGFSCRRWGGYSLKDFPLNHQDKNDTLYED